MPYLGVQPSRGLVGTAGIDANAIDGTLTKDALIADYSDVTITAADLVVYGDATDSNNTKRDTVQGILDLGGGAFENIFIADNTGNVAIATGSWTLVTFNTEVLDQGSDFDLGNDKFIAPSTGKYLFFAQTGQWLSSGEGTIQQLAILHYNSSDVLQEQETIDKTTIHEAALNGFHAFEMASSDYVLLKAYQNSGGSRDLSTPVLFGWKVA